MPTAVGADSPANEAPRGTASRLNDVWAGAAYSGVIALALVSIIAPGRYALAEFQARLGRPHWPTFASGLAHDAFDTLFVVGSVSALPFLAKRAFPARSPWVRALFFAAPSLAVALGFASSCFAEFSIQRGTFPTWFDLQGGVKDTNFITSALGVFLYGRHARPIAFGLGLFAVCMGFWRALVRTMTSRQPGLLLAGSIATTCALTTIAGLANFPYRGWFRDLGDGDVTGSPFHTFFLPISGDVTNVRFGVLGIVERADFPATEDPTGLRMLGYPPAAVTGAPCTAHPFRRPLPDDDEGAPEIVRTFVDLGRVLFDTPKPPRRLVQVVLESYRADDLHALNARAPEALAPATNRLITEAIARKSDDLSAPMLFQAGSRSSQGFTSLMCGLGTIGFNISASRDLGALPVRCLPDLFVEAGVDVHFVYGAEVSFDGVDDFLRRHGVRNIHGETTLREGLPRGVWGVSDLAVVDELFALIGRTPPSPLAWWLFPTLSNHTPFDPPEDIPSTVTARVAAATLDRTLTNEERRRLQSFSYTDHVLGEVVARVDALPDAAETLLITHADHSTTDNFLWDDAAGTQLRPKAQIPFVLHVPPALVAAHRDPLALRAALDRAQAALAALPISQNDLATLLLAIASASAPVRALPPAARWHTLGGQRTSPHWSSPTRPGATIHGLDAIGEFFAVAPSGDPLGPIVPVETISSPADITNDHTEVRPTAAVFSHFLRDWAQRCPAPESIRSAP